MLKYIGDFERLKEFGFKKYRKYYVKDCSAKEFTLQTITIDARETAKKYCSYGWIYGIYYYTNEVMVETLVELAKAGLVEKVVEE